MAIDYKEIHKCDVCGKSEEVKKKGDGWLTVQNVKGEKEFHVCDVNCLVYFSHQAQLAQKYFNKSGPHMKSAWDEIKEKCNNAAKQMFDDAKRGPNW